MLEFIIAIEIPNNSGSERASPRCKDGWQKPSLVKTIMYARSASFLFDTRIENEPSTGMVQNFAYFLHQRNMLCTSSNFSSSIFRHEKCLFVCQISLFICNVSVLQPLFIIDLKGGVTLHKEVENSLLNSHVQSYIRLLWLPVKGDVNAPVNRYPCSVSSWHLFLSMFLYDTVCYKPKV